MENKNHKWLDPATGMGNSPIAVCLRLMEGLRDEIEEAKVRANTCYKICYICAN